MGKTPTIRIFVCNSKFMLKILHLEKESLNLVSMSLIIAGHLRIMLSRHGENAVPMVQGDQAPVPRQRQNFALSMWLTYHAFEG